MAARHRWKQPGNSVWYSVCVRCECELDSATKLAAPRLLFRPKGATEWTDRRPKCTPPSTTPGGEG